MGDGQKLVGQVQEGRHGTVLGLIEFVEAAEWVPWMELLGETLHGMCLAFGDPYQ